MTSQGAIVAAVDIGQADHRAVTAALYVATSAGRPLVLLNVVRPILEIYADLNFTPLAEVSSRWLAATKEANAESCEALGVAVGVDDPNVVIKVGQPAEEITSFAEDTHAPLIVMGSRKHVGVARFVGSTTQKVVTISQRSVLIIQPESKAPGVYNTPLMAVDLTVDAARVIEQFSKQLISLPTPRLVTVIPPVSSVLPAYSRQVLDTNWSTGAIEKDLQAHALAATKNLASKSGLDRDAVDLRIGDPADQILAEARSVNADLIVLGSGSRSASQKFWLGSTTREIIHRAKCDVLVLPC